MKSIATSTLFLIAVVAFTAQAFVPLNPNTAGARSFVLSSTTSDGAIVQTNQETVQFTCGLLGFAIGTALFGPTFGLVSATTANYLARKDEGTAGDIVTKSGVFSIEAWNKLVSMESDMGLLNKAGDALAKSSPEFKESLDKAIGTVTSKAKEYEVVDRASSALQTLGDSLENLIDSGLQVAEDKGVADKINAAVKDSGVVDKVNAAVKDSTAKIKDMAK